MIIKLTYNIIYLSLMVAFLIISLFVVVYYIAKWVGQKKNFSRIVADLKSLSSDIYKSKEEIMTRSFFLALDC